MHDGIDTSEQHLAGDTLVQDATAPRAFQYYPDPGKGSTGVQINTPVMHSDGTMKGKWYWAKLEMPTRPLS
ncbi:MAG: hypothetical protein HOV84_01555 [Streptomyces sp.]|nr:hypothetical protein [Streptomyces sp.]